MAKSFAAGELYIIGETDPDTGTDTGYCKIGLVRETDGRFSADRLREHQTGNPRRLVLLHTVATEIVEAVETTLHGLYATRRISGEWFVLTSNQRSEVLTATKRLAAQAGFGVNDMRTATQLAGEESIGGNLPASEATLDAHRRGQSLRNAADRVARLSQSLKVHLESSIRRDNGENRFGYIIVRKDTSSFDESSFRECHADLWEKYQKTASRVVPYFRWQGLECVPDRFDELTALEAEASGILRESSRDSLLDTIHDLYLRLLGIEASINWELELIEARIRSACGTAPGIDGVCTWRRTLTTKVKFDAAAMKADNPELHQQFVKTKPGSTALVVARDRNFRRWQ